MCKIRHDSSFFSISDRITEHSDKILDHCRSHSDWIFKYSIFKLKNSKFIRLSYLAICCTRNTKKRSIDKLWREKMLDKIGVSCGSKILEFLLGWNERIPFVLLCFIYGLIERRHQISITQTSCISNYCLPRDIPGSPRVTGQPYNLCAYHRLVTVFSARTETLIRRPVLSCSFQNLWRTP